MEKTNRLDREWGRIAVLIPCYNEEKTIGKVVADFRASLPQATIYVYDNNSTDRTKECAVIAGARVTTEPLQGKGHVVRRMFADVDADVYVLVDGDATYDAATVSEMIEKLCLESLDMVTGKRELQHETAYRPGHQLGNKVLTYLATAVFGRRCQDMLSGYRVFSRRFVKSFAVTTSGFEIETLLTAYALEAEMPMADVPTPYYPRPEGSVSKLSTIRDGVRILLMIGMLIKEEKPLQFFTLLSCLLACIAFSLIGPVFWTYLETGLVPRFPTAILAASVMVLSSLMFVCGLILDSVARARKEIRRMIYLSYAPASGMRQFPMRRVPQMSSQEKSPPESRTR